MYCEQVDFYNGVTRRNQRVLNITYDIQLANEF
jgi:hypothetical protein